jgi:hypothetical protein
MSNPDEEPGAGRAIDWTYLRKMQRRLARLVPAIGDLGIKKAWAATIEYTPTISRSSGRSSSRRHHRGRRNDRERLRARDDVGAGGVAQSRRTSRSGAHARRRARRGLPDGPVRR